MTHELEVAFRAGFLAGFNESAEGWNGEWPTKWTDDKLRMLREAEDKAVKEFLTALAAMEKHR